MKSLDGNQTTDSYRMSRIRSVSTKPEILLRKSLWRRGFRYRMNAKNLPGSPDIILPKYKTTIFVHGCFWHGHKGCKNYTIPKTNTDFWTDKIARNQERDQEVWRQLEALGWAVIIVWECQLKKSAIVETVDHIEAEIKRNGGSLRRTKEERKQTKECYRKERKAQKEIEETVKTETKGNSVAANNQLLSQKTVKPQTLFGKNHKLIR